MLSAKFPDEVPADLVRVAPDVLDEAARASRILKRIARDLSASSILAAAVDALPGATPLAAIRQLCVELTDFEAAAKTYGRRAEAAYEAKKAHDTEARSPIMRTAFARWNEVVRELKGLEREMAQAPREAADLRRGFIAAGVPAADVERLVADAGKSLQQLIGRRTALKAEHDALESYFANRCDEAYLPDGFVARPHLKVTATVEKLNINDYALLQGRA